MLKAVKTWWTNRRKHIEKMAELKARRSKLANTDFAIVANNCWGAEVYKYYELPFNTPFIGLFLYPDCYINLLENWENIDVENITMLSQSKYVAGPLKYPVGELESGIEVHFLHYKSNGEAMEKWKRRSKRLKDLATTSNKIFFRFCDRDGAADEHFTRFAALPFQHKIAFSFLARPAAGVLPASPQPGSQQVLDGLQSFHHELQAGFDLPGWLNGASDHEQV